jgi:hypothetical protein
MAVAGRPPGAFCAMARARPPRTWHQLTVSDRELVLLRPADRPIHGAFSLVQAEAEV